MDQARRELHRDAGHVVTRSLRHDAYYCVDCDVWLDPRCSDAGCDYCLHRPDRPSEAT